MASFEMRERQQSEFNFEMNSPVTLCTVGCEIEFWETRGMLCNRVLTAIDGRMS